MKAISAIPAALFLLTIVSCLKQAPATSRQAGPDVLDRINSLVTLFPDPEERGLYQARAPEQEDGWRNYSFALKPQPGMESPRHFQLVTIGWIAASTKPPEPAAGTGGPNGAFIEKIVRTPDGAYQVRIVRGELLPAKARTANLDLDRIAARILEAYRQSTR